LLLAISFSFHWFLQTSILLESPLSFGTILGAGYPTRPVFIPISEYPFVREEILEFQWFPGFSETQLHKSIRTLHRAEREAGIGPVLEISSKSPYSMGVELSAFNLMVEFENGLR